ncbi:hypothetical protein TeGR_g12291, partial [Tetraparma gracilis]
PPPPLTPSPPSTGVSILIFGGPTTALAPPEIAALNSFVSSGGSVLYLLPPGPEAVKHNAFLKSYGIEAVGDAVVRTVYHKYLHPKQVYIANGLLHTGLASVPDPKAKSKSAPPPPPSKDGSGLTFVYPNGGTLSVSRPAFPVLSSGPISFPLNRPVCAVSHPGGSAGRLCCMGTAECFSDEYLDKEENGRLSDGIMEYLSGSLKLGSVPTPSLAEKSQVPDIASLADRLKPCLQDGDPLPQDFTQLFNDSMFRFDTSLIPASVKLYDTLNVKHEPLSLIPPQ